MTVLADPSKAGVFSLGSDARIVAREAASAGLLVAYVDIGHAHDKEHFAEHVAEALRFPGAPDLDWNGFSRGLQDLSWMPAKGWVVILEKSKHFCAGHRHEFEEAMGAMSAAAEYWRRQGRPFWTLIGGPEGWSSGWPAIPIG